MDFRGLSEAANGTSEKRILVSDMEQQATTEGADGTLAAEIQALRADIASIRALLKQRLNGSLVENPSEDAILTTHQLAEALGIGLSTVFRYKKVGMPSMAGPLGSNPRDHGRVVRFRYGDVLAWLSKTRRKPR